MNAKDCHIELESKCNDCHFIDDQVVSIECLQDPYLQCAPDEYLHSNTCYKIITEEATTHDRAKSLCEEDGGHLLQINSQVT